MDTKRLLASRVIWCAAFLAAAALVSGCVPENPTKLTVLLTGDSSGLMKALLAEIAPEKAEVPIEDIASFVVTVTEVSLDAEGSGDKQGDPGTDSKIVVFGDGDEMEVDLFDLMGVSEVLSVGEVPAGLYTKIRLSIANPRLIFVDEPETVYTNIHLTANDRLFVSQNFTLPAGQSSLILLDFGGIHLVQQGNGNFNLTPQLRVDLDIINADVQATGIIASIDAGEAGTLVLTLADGSELTVDYTAADVYLAIDTDTATGTAANLAVGQEVEVTGLLNVDGTVSASAIRILPDAPQP